MNKNLNTVGSVFVVIATGLALGMMWGVKLEDYGFTVPDLTQLAVKARPGVSLVSLVVCVGALFARAQQQALVILASAGALQVVVSVAYAVLVWVPYGTFRNAPVG